MKIRYESIKESYSGTLHWIWTRPHIGFTEWLRDGSGIFWIAGKAGSGKSTLTKHLFQSPNILRVLQEAEYENGTCRQIVISCSYFDYKGSPMAKSAEGILRSLLHQTVSAQPALFSSIERRFLELQQQRGGLIWNLPVLEECFLSVIHSGQNTRFLFLVDALDEFDGKDTIISNFFKRISDSCQANLQLIVSSRPHLDFQEGFENCTQFRMELETESDISRYANGMFKPLVDKRGYLYQTLVEDIVKHAQGLFIWVKLASLELMKAAKRGEDLKGLFLRLRDMPSAHDDLSLDEFYQRILDQMDPEELKEARAMISIVIAAPLPFKALQLRYAVHYALRQCYSEFTDEIATIRVQAVCAGLLEVYEDGILPLGVPRVRLAHRSVAQFLSNRAPSVLRIQEPNGKLITGNVLLLEACVLALVIQMGKDRKFSLDLYPENFVNFAIQFWVLLAQRAEWETEQAQAVLDMFNEP